MTGAKQGGGTRTKKPRRQGGRPSGGTKDRGTQRLLVFVHIPKTAGTTLTSLLRDNERTGTRSAGNIFKGGGGAREGAPLERLLGDGGEALKDVRFLTGHLPLGVGERLPGKLHPGYFTVLREPADRLLSHFFQIRARRGGVEEPNKLELPPLPADATLKQALELGYVHDNLQTRMLCGDPEPFGEVTDEMLERAKRNLDELVFIGLTERFDESLVLAKRRLGLRSILYKTSGRVNQQRPRGADIPAKLRRAAEAANRFDSELYEYGKELFESAPEREELDFEIDLAALRAINAGDSADAAGPVPAGFGGDEAAWEKLVSANIAVLRQDRDLTAIRWLTYKLGERDPELLERMRRMTSRRRRRHGREPDTAVEALQMLVRADARTRAGGRTDRSERE